MVRMATLERRGPVAVNKTLAACLLFCVTASLCAQNSNSPQSPSSPQSQTSQDQDSAPSGESSSRRGHHHLRVEVEDEAPEPAELKNAEDAIDKKDYAAAEQLLHTFVAAQPASYIGWFDLGFVENALGKLDDSIAAYRKSVAAKPDIFESNLNLGVQLAKAGSPDAATFLRAATELQPTSHPEEGQYRAWLALAQVIEKSQPEQALQAYRQAAALQPQEAEPHLSMGQIFEHENKFADAEAEYKQAADRDPYSPDAITALADLYMRAHKFTEAEDYLRKLAAAQPNSPANHIQLGRVLAAEGKTDAAIAELQAGIKLAPAEEEARIDLAKLYSTAGKNDLAAAEYRTLLAAHPNDAELHRQLGEALLSTKKFTEAQQEFAAAVKLKPNLGEAYSGLAFAAGENKDYALAIRALDARARLLPEVPITYFMRASAYDHLRDFKKAAANYHLFLNTANGKYPDEEWQAKHRLIAIEPKK
jgi:tetratricopeptide (TPR) repeat protein